MRLSRKSQANYVNAVDSIADSVGKMVSDGLSGLEMQNPKGLHDYVMDMVGFDALMDAATEDAAGVSALWYGEIRKEMLGDAGGIIVDSGRVPEATERAVWAIAYQAQDNGLDWFKREIANRSRYEVRRAAGESIIRYGYKDKRKVRYARVPQYSKSYGAGCPFCRMLASRGFVYITARRAGADGHYHPDCRCIVVPSFEDETMIAASAPGGVRRVSSVQVEGYDPDYLYDGFLDDLRTGALDYSKLVKGASGNTSHVARWASEGFDSAADFTGFIREAGDIEGLQLRCAVVEQEFQKSGLSSKYYDDVKAAVREMKSKLVVGNNQFHSLSIDPVADAIGSAVETHPERVAEIIDIASKNNVLVVIAKEGESDTIAYSPMNPEFNNGIRGKIQMPETASIASLEHEFQHMLTDKESGWKGLEHFRTYESEWGFEKQGYLREIEVARNLGLKDAEKAIRDKMEEVRQDIWMKHNRNGDWIERQGKN